MIKFVILLPGISFTLIVLPQDSYRYWLHGIYLLS